MSIIDDIGEYEPVTMLKIMNALMTMSDALCDWRMIVFIEQKMFPFFKNDYPFLKITSLITICKAYCYLGRYDLALQTIESQLLSEPINEQWHRYREYLCCQQDTIYLTDAELVLTPLNKQHLESFSWQYSPSIKALCNLPDFSHDDEWYEWLKNVTEVNGQPHRSIMAFAVIHQEWGFMGSVHLKVINGVGFFFYWLGEDFQGQGFGPRAVNLLLNYGFSYMGMSCCYAKVYQHNEASHKAIKKIGFTALPFKAASPYDNEVFYYMGYEKNNEDQFTELKALIEQLDDFLEVLPSQCIRPT